MRFNVTNFMQYAQREVINMDKMTKTPTSKLIWQKKYDSEKMSTIGIKVSVNERDFIKNIADAQNLKLATFYRKCAKYCIDNNIVVADIDLKIR